MKELDLLIPVFGFVLASEHWGEIGLFRRKPKVLSLLSAWGHLVGQVFLLSCLFYGVRYFILPTPGLFGAALILLPAAFALSLIQKESKLIFCGSFALTYLAVASEAEFLPVIFKVFYASFGVILFEILILGITEKLAFSQVPRKMQGMAIYLVIAALAAMIFSGIRGAAGEWVPGKADQTSMAVFWSGGK